MTLPEAAKSEKYKTFEIYVMIYSSFKQVNVDYDKLNFGNLLSYLA